MNSEHCTCKGCYYKNHTCIVSFSNQLSERYSYDFSKCPCKMCLVKTMCRRRCDEFNTFFLEDCTTARKYDYGQ